MAGAAGDVAERLAGADRGQTRHRMRVRVVVPLLFGLLIAVLIPGSVQAAAPGPASPKPNWLPADKQGFGTSRTVTSKVWFTLEGGELSEVYYPRLDTPSFRDLQFSVDGVTERDGAVHRAIRLGPDSLTFRQINTDKRGHWRLIKTYVADPSRSVVLIDVAFQSLDGRRHRVSMLADAAPSNETDTSPGSCSPSGVLASDAHMAIAVAARPALKHLACSAGSDGIVASTASDRTDREVAPPAVDAGACLRRRSPGRARGRSRVASCGLDGGRSPVCRRLARLPDRAAPAAPEPRHRSGASGVRRLGDGARG